MRRAWHITQALDKSPAVYKALTRARASLTRDAPTR